MELTADAVEFRAASGGVMTATITPYRWGRRPGMTGSRSPAGRVDQVPHHAGLGHRPARRGGRDGAGPDSPGRREEQRPGDLRARAVPGREQQHLDRPERRGGHRQLLLRPPAPGRERQPDGGDQFAARITGPPAAQTPVPSGPAHPAVGKGRDPCQGGYQAGIAVCGDHGHPRPRRADAVRLHPRHGRAAGTVSAASRAGCG